MLLLTLCHELLDTGLIEGSKGVADVHDDSMPNVAIRLSFTAPHQGHGVPAAHWVPKN
jgi:hypothetical protein